MRLQLQVQDAEVKNMRNIYFALILLFLFALISNNVRFVKWSVLISFSIFYYLWKFLAHSLKEK